MLAVDLNRLGLFGWRDLQPSVSAWRRKSSRILLAASLHGWEYDFLPDHDRDYGGTEPRL